MQRPETIRETARLVNQAGGTGIAVQVDHADADLLRNAVDTHIITSWHADTDRPLIAIGSALSYVPFFIAGTTGVADRDQGLASGFLNSAQELGADIGVTILGAIATAATLGDDIAALATGYRTGLLAAAAVTALSRRRRPTRGTVRGRRRG